ncbi:MAG: nuclear export factor [Pseudonocardia sp.]|jgi:hypothetical protein|uniref:DUF1775 domain-containing protein n=1 Tax=Pseudonocardia sp. TaxID=60912 RepID=UPI0026370458|nr:DUF1775 domain-containing protein [Pseudonocardia sp.]MCU1631114.1 nuclear export factor [Pseudonocardia sp.]
MRRVVRGTRSAVVLALLVPLVLLGAGPAAADVQLLPERTDAGAQDVTVVFRVSNDDPADPVVGLRVALPTARPLVDVRVPASPGWEVTTAAVPGRAAVGTVEWRGGPVGAEPVDLTLVVGRMPQGAGPVRFGAVQTARSGTTVVWSDLRVTGAPPPAHDALVLPYGAPAAPAAGSGRHHHGGDAARTSAGALGDPPGTASIVWSVGTVAVVALLFGLGMRELGRQQRRRFDEISGSPVTAESPVTTESPGELRTSAPRDRTP